jgi:hypothetical protein
MRCGALMTRMIAAKHAHVNCVCGAIHLGGGALEKCYPLGVAGSLELAL